MINLPPSDITTYQQAVNSGQTVRLLPGHHDIPGLQLNGETEIVGEPGSEISVHDQPWNLSGWYNKIRNLRVLGPSPQWLHLEGATRTTVEECETFAVDYFVKDSGLPSTVAWFEKTITNSGKIHLTNTKGFIYFDKFISNWVGSNPEGSIIRIENAEGVRFIDTEVSGNGSYEDEPHIAFHLENCFSALFERTMADSVAQGFGIYGCHYVKFSGEASNCTRAGFVMQDCGHSEIPYLRVTGRDHSNLGGNSIYGNIVISFTEYEKGMIVSRYNNNPDKL